MTRLISLTLLLGLLLGCDARITPGSSAAAAVPATAPGRPELVRWQFVGTAPLASTTNATRLRQLLAEPATQTQNRTPPRS